MKKLPRNALNCLAVCALLAGSLVFARMVSAAELVPPTGGPLTIDVGVGGIVRLDRVPATVFVADPKIADVDIKSPRFLYLLGKTEGDTTLFALDSQDRVILNKRVHVRHNIGRLNATLHEMMPNSRITARSINGTVVLDGEASNAADAENARQLAASLVKDQKSLVNQIKVTQPNQVNLRVRVAEVSRSVMKQFGFNWDALFAAGNFAYGISTGAPVLKTPFFGTDPIEFNSRNGGTNSGMGFYRSPGADVNVIIDALEDEGLVSILAEPNLTAVSGESATFLAGGEFPVVIVTNNNTQVQFKKFGVSLAFTPTLISRNRISLKVNPEVSELSTAGQVSVGGFAIPGISTRRAETTVELGSGQSFAIAGLLQNSITESLNSFPGLADIPILGTLFRSTSFRRKETELVIIVTPYVVRPVSPGKLASPTDGYVSPNDVDRIVHGRKYRASMERQRRNVNTGSTLGLEGPSGFVLN